ncbi:MAG: hypothetical protein WBQ08_03850 [Candidatus Sulfotelmatobacter sp.]
MSSSTAAASQVSAVCAFRVVWALWIGMSLVYAAGYFRVAVLGGRYSQGLLLASLPVLQAIWIPFYVRRKQFCGPAEAMIRSATTAVAIAGIGEAVFLMTAASFGGFRVSGDSDRLQVGYVLTVLLFAGLAGGTALGILRWRVLQRQQRSQGISPVSDSPWRNYLRSAVLWIASVTAFVWLLKWLGSRIFSWQGGFVLWGFLFGVAGLFLIAPIPVVFPRATETNRWKLTWTYSGFAALVLAAIWGFLLFISIASRFVVYVVAAFPDLCVIWIACFFWAWLYAWSGQFPAAASLSGNSPVPLHPARPPEWKVVGLTALGQIGALLAGLLATAPPALGIHGVGCLKVYSSNPSEYWFWKGYKGTSSEATLEDRIIIRPAMDSSVCVSIPTEGMDDPQSIDRGYVEAACSWFGLIDPERWESERTRQIRKELARLLGRDFSSYDELRSWWEQNRESLVWSSEDQLLEIDKTDMWNLENPYAYRQQHPRIGCSSVAEGVRQLGPQWLSGVPDGFDPAPAGRGAVLNDREARLLGLKFYVDDSIEILTGDQQRRTHEFLRNMIGSDFETEDAWRKALDQMRPTHPWNMSVIEAQDWVSLIDRTKNTAREATTRAGLQERTGLNYANVEDFVPWLENPENTRSGDWEKASRMIGDLCVDDNGQMHCPIRTLAILKQLTGKTFDSPQQWVQWWHDNRANVALSGDGRTLVTKPE